MADAGLRWINSIHGNGKWKAFVRNLCSRRYQFPIPFESIMLVEVTDISYRLAGDNHPLKE